jgi:tripartite-type tricarboxylate transporter receptor subunit TctC
MNHHPRVAAALFAAAFAAAAPAQQWTPKSAVRIVVPFPAGGPTDITARHLARPLTEILGQQVIVDNRGGANGMIGGDFVVRSKPDGLTLLMPTSSTVAINPAVYKKMPFDPVTDLAPVTPVIRVPDILFVTPSFPAIGLREFIVKVRAQPNVLVFASTGAGSNTHLALEMLADAAKLKVTHVPYKGAGPAVTDVMAGHAQAMVADLPVLVAHLKSGKLRAIAVTGANKTSLFPDIPTTKELGYPQVNMTNWYALLAPAGTPPQIVNRLNEAVRQAVAQPELRDRLVGLGADVHTLSPEEFGAFLKSEIQRFKAVATKYKISL